MNDTCIAHTLIIQIHKLGELDWLGRYIYFDSWYCLTFLGKLEILRSLSDQCPTTEDFEENVYAQGCQK